MNYSKNIYSQPLSPASFIVPEFPIEEPHSIMFAQLTGNLIHDIALKTDGAAGPSGIDAHGWSRLVTSFHKALSDLYDALGTLG